MPRRLGGRVVQTHEARRAVRALRDPEDAAEALFRERVFVEDLHLDVPRALHGLLEEHARVAEGALSLAHRLGQRGGVGKGIGNRGGQVLRPRRRGGQAAGEGGERQDQAAHRLSFSAYLNAFPGRTPSFLKIILEKAVEMGVALPSVKKALVSGEAFPPSLRDWMTERGVNAYQCYATADVGLIAYETSARQGLVIDEGVIVEIVRPGTGDPVPEGEVGELVITSLNPHYPLIRFGTGDLSAILVGTCPTGRTNQRIKGWMGRADQTTKVRGMFVHPGQVAEVVKRFPAALRARLVVQGEMANDSMALHVETTAAHGAEAELKAQIAEAIRDVTKLRSDVHLVAPGTLANDGKVIEDARSYQ